MNSPTFIHLFSHRSFDRLFNTTISSEIELSSIEFGEYLPSNSGIFDDLHIYWIKVRGVTCRELQNSKRPCLLSSSGVRIWSCIGVSISVLTNNPPSSSPNFVASSSLLTTILISYLSKTIWTIWFPDLQVEHFSPITSPQVSSSFGNLWISHCSSPI